MNRKSELARLNQLSRSASGGLAVLWGRRRVGKTRLLLEWIAENNGLYAVADQSAGPVQRRYLAESVAQVFPDFAGVVYPDWRAFFNGLAKAAQAEKWRGPFVIDELPYLVAQDKSLPSVLQAWIDHQAREARLTVAFAGSAQQMMHGMVLDSSAPLYGRASEILKISPLTAGYLGQAIKKLRPSDIIKAYSVWGGIPKYWELAEPFGKDLDRAVEQLVLDPLGVLHEEPDRLLSREMPSASSLRPLLDAIGGGAHRISEIGGRLGLPASALSEKVSRLVALGLVKREQPFGASEKRSKKTLYKAHDPFTRMWFSVVASRRGFLAAAAPVARRRLWDKAKPRVFAEGFEQLARDAVSRLPKSALGGVSFGPAGRYWENKGPEWDVVALSEDGDRLLLGEVKWHHKDVGERGAGRMVGDLLKKGIPNDSRWKNLEIVRAVFVPELSGKNHKKQIDSVHIVEGDQIIKALK